MISVSGMPPDDMCVGLRRGGQAARSTFPSTKTDPKGPRIEPQKVKAWHKTTTLSR